MRVRALDLAKEKGERDEFTRGHAASERALGTRQAEGLCPKGAACPLELDGTRAGEEF